MERSFMSTVLMNIMIGRKERGPSSCLSQKMAPQAGGTGRKTLKAIVGCSLSERNTDGDNELSSLNKPMITETSNTKTEVGNYFVSNYPTFSQWKPEYIPDVSKAL